MLLVRTLLSLGYYHSTLSELFHFCLLLIPHLYSWESIYIYLLEIPSYIYVRNGILVLFVSSEIQKCFIAIVLQTLHSNLTEGTRNYLSFNSTRYFKVTSNEITVYERSNLFRILFLCFADTAL